MDLAAFIVGFYFLGIGLVSYESKAGKTNLIYGIALIVLGIIVQGGRLPILGR